VLRDRGRASILQRREEVLQQSKRRTIEVHGAGIRLRFQVKESKAPRCGKRIVEREPGEALALRIERIRAGFTFTRGGHLMIFVALQKALARSVGFLPGIVDFFDAVRAARDILGALGPPAHARLRRRGDVRAFRFFGAARLRAADAV
jgi:hypothetical protein